MSEPVSRTASVTLSGASDDLIELAGDIYDEFTYNDGEPGDLIAFSDGTVLRIRYDDNGVWRISPVTTGSARLGIEQAPEGDEDNYTDKATLTGDVRWAVHGIGWAHT